MKKTKIIAMYLPQYHCIPENDEFWGKGFTDWVTVKKAKPLFEGHQQPRVPLNNNYYDLSIKENVKWQSDLAIKYGIDGFGVYHYWFNNEKNILTKPAEIIRDNDDILINYFLAWDNYSWRRTWSNLPGNSWAPTLEAQNKKGPSTLIEYILGNKQDWKKHYNYVKSHFYSDKYIKIENKPVFIIFYFSDEIDKMCNYWNELSKQDGFDGIYFIFKRQEKGRLIRMTKEPNRVLLFNYEPMYNGWQNTSLFTRIYSKVLKSCGIKKEGYTVLNYDKIWEKILRTARGKCNKKNILHGGFVAYDDSPRRGKKRGVVILGSTPEKFHGYLKELLEISQQQEKAFVFITAWNEWGEGAYLEPDTHDEYKYLEAIKQLQNDKSVFF